MSNIEQSRNPVVEFNGFMQKLKPQMALALPKHMNADRMTRLALTAFSSDHNMQACSFKSIASSLMTAGALGLEPGVNGACYLIPYKGTCTLVPGWKGLVDLVSRSGRATVWTGAVFEGDEFDYALGDRPFVMHRPGDETDPDKLTHVYAIGRVNGSDYPVIEVWSMRKVWKHRDKGNKQGAKHYSYRHPEMYARKIPLLQVLKYMPSSIEVANAVAISDAADSGRGAVIEHGIVLTQDEPAEAPAQQQAIAQAPAPVHIPTPQRREREPVRRVAESIDQRTGEIQQSKMLPGLADLLADIDNAPDREAAELVLREGENLLPGAEFGELRKAFEMAWNDAPQVAQQPAQQQQQPAAARRPRAAGASME